MNQVVIASSTNKKLAMYNANDPSVVTKSCVIKGTFATNKDFDEQDWGIFTTLGGMRYKINRNWEVTGLILGRE